MSFDKQFLGCIKRILGILELVEGNMSSVGPMLRPCESGSGDMMQVETKSDRAISNQRTEVSRMEAERRGAGALAVKPFGLDNLPRGPRRLDFFHTECLRNCPERKHPFFYKKEFFVFVKMYRFMYILKYK